MYNVKAKLESLEAEIENAKLQLADMTKSLKMTESVINAPANYIPSNKITQRGGSVFSVFEFLFIFIWVAKSSISFGWVKVGKYITAARWQV